jgi:hypothetical protein
MAANAHVTLPEQQPMGEHAIQQPSGEQFAELSQSIGLADQQLFAAPHASQQQQATLQELAHLQERIRQDREQLALERAQMHAMTQQSSQPYHSFASTPWEQQQPPSSASYYTLGGRPVHQDSFCTSSTSPPPHCSLHSTYSTNTWDGSRPTLVSEQQQHAEQQHAQQQQREHQWREQQNELFNQMQAAHTQSPHQPLDPLLPQRMQQWVQFPDVQPQPAPQLQPLMFPPPHQPPPFAGCSGSHLGCIGSQVRQMSPLQHPPPTLTADDMARLIANAVADSAQATALAVSEAWASRREHENNGKTPSVKDLGVKEIEAHVCDLSAQSISDWVDPFWRKLRSRDSLWEGRISMLKQCTTDTVGALCSRDPIARECNKWIASQAEQCLKHDADRVIAFKKRNKPNPVLMSDGVSLIAAIVSLSKYELGAPERAARAVFERRTWFKLPMTLEVAESTVRDFLEEFERLSLFTGEVSAQQTLLSKLPAELHGEHGFCEVAEQRILDQESLGQAEYTREQIIKVVSARLARTSAKPRSVAAVELTRETEAKETTAREVSAAAAATAAKSDDDRCVNCGKKGHMSKECKQQCSKCGIKICPGIHSACVVCSDVDVPKPLKNAIGKNYPAFLRNILVKANAKSRGIDVPKETSAGEREPEAVDDHATMPETQSGLTFSSASCAERCVILPPLECNEQSPDVHAVAASRLVVAIMLQSRWRASCERRKRRHATTRACNRSCVTGWRARACACASSNL